MNPPVQIVLPQSLVNSIGNSNSTWLPLANISITDTAVHSYITNPQNIAIIQLGNLLGSGNRQISSYAVWVSNTENQPLTVTPITNIVNDGSYPDIFITGAQSIINSNSTVWIPFSFNDFPVEYFSIQLSFSTAPTSGSILAVLFIYYGD